MFPEVKVPVEPNGLVRVSTLLEIEQPDDVLMPPLTYDIEQDAVLGRVMVEGKVICI